MSTYTINTLHDVLAIPADRRAAFFKEMALALSFHELTFGEDAQAQQFGPVTWADDGNASVTLMQPNGETFLKLEITKEGAP